MVTKEQEKKWEVERKFKEEKKKKAMDFVEFLMEEYDLDITIN